MSVDLLTNDINVELTGLPGRWSKYLYTAQSENDIFSQIDATFISPYVPHPFIVNEQSNIILISLVNSYQFLSSNVEWIIEKLDE